MISKKAVLLISLIIALFLGGIAFWTVLSKTPSYSPITPLTKKKAVIIIFSNYNPIEYSVTRETLEKNEVSTYTITVNEETGLGTLITQVDPTVLASEYDALIIIGGPGVYERVIGRTSEPRMPLVINLIKTFHSKNKTIAAICAAPAILSKAGILYGKKATVFPSRDLIDILLKGGAQYTGEAVTVDGNIITANGPNAASSFAETIVTVLRSA